MAACPCAVLRETVIEEDLEERVEFGVLCGNDGIQTEQNIEVEDRREAKGGCYKVESSRLRGRGREGADVGELVFVGSLSTNDAISLGRPKQKSEKRTVRSERKCQRGFSGTSSSPRWRFPTQITTC